MTSHEMHPILNVFDNGGRRTNLDRRRFAYSSHVPERRSGKERRSGIDRRHVTMAKKQDERRAMFYFETAGT
jgi:hypothetical protein